MTGGLLAGAGPVLGDRYERGARKVSSERWKVESSRLKAESPRSGMDGGAAVSAEPMERRRKVPPLLLRFCNDMIRWGLEGGGLHKDYDSIGT